MSILLTDLIARVPPGIEPRVRRARDQVQRAVRDALSEECRLMFRVPTDPLGAQVPVEVSPGHPAILRGIEFPDDFERIMLLGRYRARLEQARDGTTGLLKLRDELLRLPEPEKWTSATTADLQSVQHWAAALLTTLDQHDPLKRILSVSEDILGVYEYDASDMLAEERTVNRATIRLYWGVVGFVSEWLGCEVEDLAIVVLTHELAHGYTQLGADIEGRRWPAPLFARAETALKEGLAQYYTERVLRRLDHRAGSALAVFYALLPKQSDAYRAHEPWVKGFSPEAVRRAMLEVRRWKEGGLEDFNKRLKAAKMQLDPD